ncbi:MAG: CarD family transcriptional regulator [Alphaproteobacteria bacterium]|nr:CarD family transcriptional regulator [Alphaproteobacteria bacterium]
MRQATRAAGTRGAAACVKPAAVKKIPAQKAKFAVNDHVVYPTHGVGKIVRIEEQEISGYQLKVYVVFFEKDKMTLRVPVDKAESTRMRVLSSKDQMRLVLLTLKGRARVRRTMWSRRAQEYEAKINSGDPMAIAEVIRDLHRTNDQPDQSYSERQIYETALDRLAREFAAVEEIDEVAAGRHLEEALRAA